ncbi:GNAT family N-acetyltransferase [Halobacterium wangiae]|uniref:GNAT family N-acetyltransferase n=1 Tax=Halobacterium wangiae TaxID=2902623 RepID=UPI001E290D47|nr:GNAT family N-acetyltransferase [Halobacterium wangiae]
MDVREATTADRDGIRRVADASLEATYADALGEDIVRTAAEEWYQDERLADRLDDDGVQYLVLADGDEVVAFSESEFDGDAAAAIEWLHVHPDYRDRGFGVRLLERTEAALTKSGANRIEGRVLAANDEGNQFYQAHGYARTGEHSVDVAGNDYTEHLYVKVPGGGSSAELTERVETAAGPMFVAFDERERGSKAPFYTAYRNENRESKYGFYCANCQSINTSMDSMGRVHCEDCGNQRKATRWDSSYL